MVMNDEQRQAYQDGLDVELAGYQQKLDAANNSGDDASAKLWQSQIDGVNAEIARFEAEAVSDGEGVVDEQDAPKSRKTKSS